MRTTRAAAAGVTRAMAITPTQATVNCRTASRRLAWGQTLVVETNLSEQRPWLGFLRGPSIDESSRLVERLTRAYANTIDYQLAVDDPTIGTKPCRATVSVVKA